ncbi:MFS transporter [uncultured Sutterella sp.]|uniref:MFS transporter n=1 Tax=uncultured Sutterella sp. TaxID=286133 RepID=UPI0025F3EE13|nr:MFS transporter [uncultured Sutterella sp.]
MSSAVLSPRRLCAAAAGTPFLDGYATGSAAFLIMMIPGMTAWETGAFTGIYLLVFSVGAVVFGWLADHFGRRRIFSGSMLALGAGTIASLLLFGASADVDATVGAAQLSALLGLRALMGLLLGGDYPVGQALITELIAEEERAQHLSLLMFGWYAGALFAVLLSRPIFALDLSWTTFLWVQAALALLFWAARRGVPESAAWSAARRRADAAPGGRRGAFSEPGSLRAFLFCTVFWLAQTIPATVLMFYSTKILSGFLDTKNAFIQVLLLYGCFLLGVLPAAHPALARCPKAVLIGTFLAMAASLAAVTLGRDMHSTLMTGAAFILFALAYGLQTPLDFVFPNMLFPARTRARLVGLTTTVSRVGSMGAAFAFPVLAEEFPVAALFWSGCAVLLFGALFSWRFAPADRG